MANKNEIKFTSHDSLFAFAKAMRDYAYKMQTEINKLKKDTDDTMSYAWKGKKAEEFAGVISDSSQQIEAQIRLMENLADAIKEKAEKLQLANERKYKKF